MNALATARPSGHLLGRCPVKGCKTTARLDTFSRVVGRTQYGWDKTETAFIGPSLQAKSDPSGVARFLDPTVHGWIVEEAFYSFSQAFDHIFPMCVEHHRNLRWTTVQGRQNDEVRCDARCMNARRSSCECSCGGANHGGRWG